MKTLYALLALPCCSILQARAQDHDTSKHKNLSTVVITGNGESYTEKEPSTSLRLQTPLLETPQNIQIVGKAMLKDQQVISMSDGLIRNVSGLIRMEHWGDLYTNITARGSQIQALRNGFNVVNSYWGPLTEDMSFTDKIEFIKGPAGFLISSGDASGMYNVVTKKPTGESKGEAAMTVGSFGLYRGSLDLDGKLSRDGKLLYRLNVAAQNRKSHRANEYNDRYVVAPVISYQLDAKTKLSLEYTYQRANMSNVGSYYVFDPNGFATRPVGFTQLPAGMPGVQINDHSAFFLVEHELNKDWKINAQAARFEYRQLGSSAWPGSVQADGSMIRNISIWDAQSSMSMAQFFVNGMIQTGPLRHKILAGLDLSQKEYLADWTQTKSIDDTNHYFNPNAADFDVNTMSAGYPVFDRSLPLEQRARAGFGFQTLQSTGIYVQDEIGLWKNRVRLTLGGRYTDMRQAYAGPEIAARQFTPRAGISYSLNKQTAIYALLDRSFVPQSGILSSGESVRPITGTSMEAGIKRNWWHGRWSSGITAYRIVKQHELIADPAQSPASGLSIELGEKTVKGLECDLKGTIVRGLNFVANYAYTDARVGKLAPGITALKEGDPVPGFARHTANSWLTYRLQDGPFKGWGLSAGATFLGKRFTYWDPSPNGQMPADYFKMDAGISWESGKMSVQAQVFNLLNSYLYSGSYYSWLKAYYWQTDPPRNLRLTIRYSF